jgi:mannose-6-phosphate isomerase-like protein (cupin superfamily)
MAAEIVHLRRDTLVHEYGVHTQRLLPWDVLNAPFEGAWCVVAPHSTSTPHSHHEHEIFIAVRGATVLECDGQTNPFVAGDVAYFQPRSQHFLHNESDEEFVFYSVWWDEDMSERFVVRNRAENTA